MTSPCSASFRSTVPTIFPPGTPPGFVPVVGPNGGTIYVDPATLAIILHGSGDPSDAIGIDGNYYLNTDSPGAFWGPKAGGTWVGTEHDFAGGGGLVPQEIVYGASDGTFAQDSQLLYDDSAAKRLTVGNELVVGFDMLMPDASDPTTQLFGGTIIANEPLASPGAASSVQSTGNDGTGEACRATLNAVGSSGGTPTAYLSVQSGTDNTNSSKSQVTAKTSIVTGAGAAELDLLVNNSNFFQIRIYEGDLTAHFATGGSGTSVVWDFNPRANWSLNSGLSTGFTVTMVGSEQYAVLDSAGSMAAGTVNLPASPFDGQRVGVSTCVAITTLTVSGNGHSIKNGTRAMAAGDAIAFIYNASGTTWYPCP